MSSAARILAICSMIPLIAGTAFAGLDGDAPFLCAVTEAIECDEDGHCVDGSADDANLPDFLWVDLKAKKLSEHRGERSTVIRSQERKDGRIVLQGVDLRAWSLSISEETGQFTGTASGHEVGFVFFGVCTRP